MNPSPCHAAGRGDRPTGGCGTTTPFGAPVVPEVYMMSVGGAVPAGRGGGDPSGSSSADHAVVPAAGPVVASSRSPGSPLATSAQGTPASVATLATMAPGSAWPRMARSSGAASRVLTGTATAPARWAAV